MSLYAWSSAYMSAVEGLEFVHGDTISGHLEFSVCFVILENHLCAVEL